MDFFERITISTEFFTVVGCILTIIGIILGWRYRNKPPKAPVLVEPRERAIPLCKPAKIKDICRGRDKLLETVFKVIEGTGPNFFVGNHVYIAGQEGIGKTLFCQNLFKYKLEKTKTNIGWIECNGEQSIFEIIGKTFEDPRFRKKSKENILTAFENLERPCVLFIDQFDLYTPHEELEELILCSNITLVVSGLQKNLHHLTDKNRHFVLPPLDGDSIKKVFEKKLAGEEIDLMRKIDRSDVMFILGEYVKGNPFLAEAFASAKVPNNTWKDLINNMRRREYYDENSPDYIKTQLIQLYRIRDIEDEEKSTLSKLSIFSSLEYAERIFEWCGIPMDSIERLSRTHWLEKKDSITYVMNETRHDVLKRTLEFTIGLRNVIISLTDHLESWEAHENRGFEQIVFYIEDILKKVKGPAHQIMKESDLFAPFAYRVAEQYFFTLQAYEKSHEWLMYCTPENIKYQRKSLSLVYHKARLEWFLKCSFMGKRFTSHEVEEAYNVALEKLKMIENPGDQQERLMDDYCTFLIDINRYAEAKEICSKHFDEFGFELNDKLSCLLFYRYLVAAERSDDEGLLKQLVNDATFSALVRNKNQIITIPWSLKEMADILRKWDMIEKAYECEKHMVILHNRYKSFFHKFIKDHLKMTDEEFTVYMHSDDELRTSLDEAIEREDAEALYLKGRYHERNEEYEEAYSYYERAAANDSLKGRCALAVVLYKGLGVPQDYDKAREYWDYCCKREHRGSFYQLGLMLLDENYHGYDKELAFQYLAKAAEMGNEKAKQKISEISEEISDIIQSSHREAEVSVR